jgi:hypothetical protein
MVSVSSCDTTRTVAVAPVRQFAVTTAPDRAMLKVMLGSAACAWVPTRIPPIRAARPAVQAASLNFTIILR